MIRRVDRELELLCAGRFRSNEAEAVPTTQRDFVGGRGGAKQDDEDEGGEEEVHYHSESEKERDVYVRPVVCDVNS